MTSTIISVLIALILFAIKNWADIVAVKKAVQKTQQKWEEINADGKRTDKEKEEFAAQLLDTFNRVLPVLTSVWKWNWKKKRELDEIINSK
jgi:hypothetical protein